jgi:hypothetical protein
MLAGSEARGGLLEPDVDVDADARPSNARLIVVQSHCGAMAKTHFTLHVHRKTPVRAMAPVWWP